MEIKVETLDDIIARMTEEYRNDTTRKKTAEDSGEELTLVEKYQRIEFDDTEER